jgi:hypothetical protein
MMNYKIKRLRKGMRIMVMEKKKKIILGDKL